MPHLHRGHHSSASYIRAIRQHGPLREPASSSHATPELISPRQLIAAAAQHGGAHTEREVLPSGREAWHRRTPRRPLFAPSGPLSRKKASAPLASAVLPFIVTKRAPRAFIVERTAYGWSVKAGAERLGLFVTQRQALTDVGRRRAELKASGQTTTLVVASGSEPVLETRPFRAW